jgi:hypothetical protein
MAEKKKLRGRASRIAEIVVRRGALRRFDKLKTATADLPVKLSWDRRSDDRRTGETRVAGERRKGDRRQQTPFTWNTADFVVVEKRVEKRRPKR